MPVNFIGEPVKFTGEVKHCPRVIFGSALLAYLRLDKRIHRAAKRKYANNYRRYRCASSQWSRIPVIRATGPVTTIPGTGTAGAALVLIVATPGT